MEKPSLVDETLLLLPGYNTKANMLKNEPMSSLSFRSLLADQLTGKFCNRKTPGPKLLVTKNKLKKPSGRYVGVDNSCRKMNVGNHLPV
ncbi:hypothetical protein HHI36_017949, partial [Cryptolaemus montrouzieri]